MKIIFLCLFFGPVLAASENEHSLYYQYTAQSNLYRDDLFECTAVTVLDGRQIDSYNIRDGLRTPKQDWLTKLPRTDWNRGTAELNDYGHWLNNRFHLVIKDFKHNTSDVHVLQWRFGCETEATFKVVSFINEFGYDGEDLIYYDWTSKRWKASVWQAQHTAEKWNYQRLQNTLFVTCEELMKIYVNYSSTQIRQSPLVVDTFAKRAVNNPGKLTLTCMTTGFYPKDVKMSVRKNGTSLPEHLITSSGVRPNEDDTYQLRKSLDILENDDADYDCYVTHRSLKEPVINKWDGKCINCPDENVLSVIGGVVGALVLLAVVGAITYYFIKKRNVHSDTDASNGSCKVPAEEVCPADVTANMQHDGQASVKICCLPLDSRGKGEHTDTNLETDKGVNLVTDQETLVELGILRQPDNGTSKAAGSPSPTSRNWKQYWTVPLIWKG